MNKNVFFGGLCVLAFLSCDQQPTPSVPESDEIIVDNLSVRVSYDNTPGFLYPMLRHDVDFTGHRTTPGYIDFFEYSSEGVKSQILVEYRGDGAPAGTAFDFRNTYWSDKITPAGGRVSYSFKAGSMAADEFDDPVIRTGEVLVQADSNGERPVSNSLQLAGAADSGFLIAGISTDGSLVYFLKNTAQQGWIITSVPAMGGDEQSIAAAGGRIISAAFDAENSRLVLTSDDLDDALLLYSLNTGVWDTLRVASSFKTRQLVALSIPGKVAVLHESGGESPLLRAAVIDLASGALTPVISVSLPVGNVVWMSSVPGTAELALAIDGSSSIMAIDYTTNAVRRLYDGFSGAGFQVLSQDGRLVRLRQRDPDENTGPFWQTHWNLFVENGGTGEWLTTYPGMDELPLVSQDGRFLIFIAKRRGHSGIWRLTVHP